MGLTEWLADTADAIDKYTNPFHGSFGPSTNEKQKAAAAGVAPPTDQGFAAQPLESVLSAVRHVGSEYISRPLTTFELMAQKAAGNWGGMGQDLPKFFNGNEWSKSWNAAQHISPGQLELSALQHGTGQVQALENAPLEYKRPDQLPQGFDQLPWQQQQDALKAAGMPVQGNALIEKQRREDPFFKYGSGVLDFGVSLGLDPLVLGGKAVGGVKAGVLGQGEKATWTGAKIDQIMADSPMTKTQQYLFANRSNPQLLNNLDFAKKTSMGPQFGAIMSTLKTPEEVNLFLRAGMGDTRAIDELTSRNAQAAAIMLQDKSRLSTLELTHSRFANNPGMQALVESEMARLNGRIASNTDLAGRYQQVLANSHTIDQLNITRWSFAKAEADTAAQNQYSIGPARNAAGQLVQDRSFTAQRAIGYTPRQPGEPLLAWNQDVANVLQRPVEDALPGGAGVVSTRLFTNFFQTPVTVLRSFGEFRPRGHIQIGGIDRDSVNELRGYVARIPGINAADRGRMVNAFLSTANEGERANLLDGYERQAVGAVAAQHGFTSDEADALFQAHQVKQNAEKAALMNASRYSAVKMPGPTPEGLLPVDAFPDGAGGYKIHPNLVSRLINDRQMTDLDLYNKVLGRNASALKALRNRTGSAADWVANSADFLNSAWKFSTLLRIGYIPRVLGDDLAGQMARLGSAQMALRAGWGIKNAATNVARAYSKPFIQARQAVTQEGLNYANEELGDLAPQIAERQAAHGQMLRANKRDVTNAQVRVNRAQAAVNALDPADQSAEALAARQLLAKHQGALGQAQLRQNIGLPPGQLTTLQSMLDRRDYLQQHADLAARSIADMEAMQEKVFQGSRPTEISPGFTVPGAYSGQRGQMYQAQTSSEDSINSIFRTNKDLVHGNLRRLWDHGAEIVNAVADPKGHMAAWEHVINAHFGNDALAREALAGNSVRQMTDWLLRDPKGIAYRDRIGESLTPADDLARKAHYEVNETVPTPELRAAALSPDGVNADQLAKQFPDVTTRPDVHRAQMTSGFAGGNGQTKGLSKIMNSWFKWATTIPADRMSRHPLFNQLYEGHARTIWEQETSQRAFEQVGGQVPTTANDAERIAEAARKLALRDMRGLVFDIAHQTDAGAALKFISPFFAATTEAWQRWGRIVAEKPQVAGYAEKFFNAPLAIGVTQDKDGNPIDDQGFAYDPVTKTRNLVPKGDRHIVMRLPKFLVEGHNPIGLALGASPAGDINLSQDSMNLVLSGDPWWNPGQGPIVTIPVSEFVRDKPSDAELARKIGVLPFGPSTSTAFGGSFAGRVVDQALPRTIKDALTAFDTSDSRYQAAKAQIMQRAAFEHANFGKAMPTATEIADRTRNFWLFTAASAVLGPVSNTTQDPYQFYRDEYNKMSRAAGQAQKDQFGRSVGPSADTQFLDKYGESYFAFAQAMSKNKSGAPATKQAVALSQKYADLIAASPDLAGLIIGPEGNGPFSPEAYSYQLNTPLTPGGAEMQRVRLTADEAMVENQKRLGWAKYTARMNDLHAQLFARGLTSFQARGAKDLQAQKTAYTDLYSKPLFPDGTENPYYLADWAKDFNSYDKQKYNELIPQMTALVRSPLADDPRRTDLQMLQEYLGARQSLNEQLAQRGGSRRGSANLNAKTNEGLKNQWLNTVTGLVEADTSFGDLYHRFLSRDMGTDVLSAIPSEVVPSGP